MTSAGPAVTATPPVPAAAAAQKPGPVSSAGVPVEGQTTTSSTPAARIRSAIDAAGSPPASGAPVYSTTSRGSVSWGAQLRHGQIERGRRAPGPAGPHGAQAAQHHGLRRRPRHRDRRGRRVGDERAAGRRRGGEDEVRGTAEPDRQHRTAVGGRVDDQPQREPVRPHRLRRRGRRGHAVHGHRDGFGPDRARRRRAPPRPAGPDRPRPRRAPPRAATGRGRPAHPAGSPGPPAGAARRRIPGPRDSGYRTGSADTMTLSR